MPNMRHDVTTETTIGQARQPGTTPILSTIQDIGTVREDALAQIARFRGVLERSHSASVDDCRRDMEILRGLKLDIPSTLSQFETMAEPGDTTLLAALRDTVNELEPLEREIRQRLEWFNAGSPAGMDDLRSFREELAERAARRELGESVVTTPPVLEVTMRRSSMAGIPLLIFGTGWLTFTTFHATLMIGGFSRAFGAAAFFLLAFYAIFYMVGFGMLWGGITMFRRETLTLSGSQLTMRYNLWGHTWEKHYTLDKKSRAWVTSTAVQNRGSINQEIALITGDGKELRMGNGLPVPLLHDEAGRINDYLHSVFGKGAIHKSGEGDGSCVGGKSAP